MKFVQKSEKVYTELYNYCIMIVVRQEDKWQLTNKKSGQALIFVGTEKGMGMGNPSTVKACVGHGPIAWGVLPFFCVWIPHHTLFLDSTARAATSNSFFATR